MLLVRSGWEDGRGLSKPVRQGCDPLVSEVLAKRHVGDPSSTLIELKPAVKGLGARAKPKPTTAQTPLARAAVDVAPAPGTFVAFWSDRLVHDVSEVTECAGPEDARWALTVWLCAEEEGAAEATPAEVLRVHFPEAVGG